MQNETASLTHRIPKDGALAVGADEVDALREESQKIREVDTRFNGVIEVFQTADGEYILAEQTLQRQPVIRKVGSPAQADELIRSRLEVYDRMWDGCGCTVDFFGNVSCTLQRDRGPQPD